MTSSRKECTTMLGDEVTVWLRGLRAGDVAAIDAVWQAYYDKLTRLLRRRVQQAPLKIADEEDIALSALNSFYDGVQQGRFPKLDDRHDLWKILVTIACRKFNAFRDRQRAQKRGGGNLRGESVFGLDPAADQPRGIEQVLGSEPTPEVAAAVAETIELLLSQLRDPLLRSIATFKMEGYTNEEIAVKLSCTTRTVERKLERIRQEWSSLE
jgi:DNA-directed RNA polymerase specialized sigma24 family protein